MRYLLFLCLLLAAPLHAAERTLLNVSYDPTREFYQDYNSLFVKHWHELRGETIAIRQSHGGSAHQARAVIDGLPADIVTLALAADIDAIARNTPLIPKDWQQRLPHNSAPYTSTIVFLVHAGNPKGIKDWDDVVKPGIKVITPNPKTSGGARWNYLAAWAYAIGHYPGDEKKAEDFMRTLFANVPVLDTGARGATTTFTRRDIGDVLIAWENEAYLAMKATGADKFEIVYPSVSMQAEPAVTVVDGIAKAHHTEDAAWEYLHFLYTPEAQEIAAKHYYRPVDPVVMNKFKDRFSQIERMETVEDLGGWNAVNARHFADGALFDRIYGQ